MLSLLSHVSRHPRSYFSASSASALTVLGRAHYSSAPEVEWTPTHQYSNQYNEARARRVAADPEYLERERARSRAWHKDNKDKANARARRYAKERPQERRPSSEELQRYQAAWRSRWASDHHFHQRECLKAWITKTPWVRDLVWPTHNLVYPEEKVLRYCAGCKSQRPLRLWWQDKKTDDFLCHPCFTSDWSRALPIGYEDKIFRRRKPSGINTASTSKSEP